MYTHHFGLREKPFQIAPSPKFLYPSETHDESRARILYGVEDSRGFVVVYGKVGLGKTTVLLSVLEELDPATRTALLYQTVPSFLDLLRMIAHEFGLPSEGRDEVNLIWDLNEFFIQRLADGEKCVLIVDEAQNLGLDVLEKLRTLSNLQTEEASLLQIVLVGQPELYEKLMDPRLLQLRQRVGVWHEIEALDEEESSDYILHRLQRAGARRPKDIIDKELCRVIHDYTEGVPRIINQVCDTAMMIAYGREAPRVVEDDVLEAARELHLDTVAPALATDHGTAVAPEPPRRPPRTRSRAPRIWARVAVVAVLLAAMLSVAWFLRDRIPVEFLSASAPQEATGTREAVAADLDSPVEAIPTPVELAAEPAEEAVGGEAVEAKAETQPEAVETAVATPPVESQYQKNCERMREHLVEVEAWRKEGRSVYTVHLHSFKQMQRAVDFADGLCRGEVWEQPLFVEKLGEDPVWYRVLAGGFVEQRDARTWIEELKRKDYTGYAQATRLARRAQVLLPRGTADDFAQQGVDG